MTFLLKHSDSDGLSRICLLYLGSGIVAGRLKKGMYGAFVLRKTSAWKTGKMVTQKNMEF